VLEPQAWPLGLKVHEREVAWGPLATHWPLALQVLLVMVPASEPVVEHPPPTCEQTPVHIVLEPHGVPDGLKVQLREVAVLLVTTHWPLALQVLV
jgi:hypothetical protein